MTAFNNSIRTALGILLTGAASIVASPAHACGQEPYIGMVCMTAASFCPQGYAEANGAILPISQNTALFSLIGTTYGGNGTTTFALPDLRGRSPMGQGQGPGLSPVPQGETRGAESATLSVANMPPHSHPANAVSADGTSAVAANVWPANPVGDYRGTPVPANGYATGGSAVTLNTGVVGSTGGGIPVSTLPPQLGMRYCVATVGIYPSRP